MCQLVDVNLAEMRGEMEKLVYSSPFVTLCLDSCKLKLSVTGSNPIGLFFFLVYTTNSFASKYSTTCRVYFL